MSRECNLSRRGLLAAGGIAGLSLLGGSLEAADEQAGTVSIPAVKDKDKICQDRFLPPERQLEALKAAAGEDPKNDVMKLLPHLGEQRAPGTIALGLDPSRAAIFFSKKWKQKRELKVGFFSGSAAVRKKVQMYAEMWHEVVNVSFLFGKPGPYEIRIDFNPSVGSWSYMGTDNLTIPANQPTMNFGWVTETSGKDSDRAVVLHEFGHALGLIHEHQSPGGFIQWNRQVVIAAMWQSAGWSAQEVEEQIFRRYSTSQTQYTRLDTKSIMMYPFPGEWTFNLPAGTPWNTDLSQMDIDFMKTHYPKA